MEISNEPTRTLANTNRLIETEGLFAGKIAFILGRRGKQYDSNTVSITDTDAANQGVPFRSANTLSKFAIGGADINTMQRMCSFEYLHRYFFQLLKTKIIVLGSTPANPLVTDDDSIPAMLNRHRPLLKTFGALNVDGKKILSEIAAKSNETLKLDNDLLDSLETCGIFAADDGPFLRGKSLEVGVVKIYKGGSNSLSAKNIATAIGDNIAFSRLQALIAERGAADWTPDGIVHSKLSQGDAALDEELDSRDGMLFNVTVKGPNVTSSWSHNRYMLTQPLDKVFVVIVADVWDANETPWSEADGTTSSYTQYMERKKRKKTNQ